MLMNKAAHNAPDELGGHHLPTLSDPAELLHTGGLLNHYKMSNRPVIADAI